MAEDVNFRFYEALQDPDLYEFVKRLAESNY